MVYLFPGNPLLWDSLRADSVEKTQPNQVSGRQVVAIGGCGGIGLAIAEELLQLNNAGTVMYLEGSLAGREFSMDVDSMKLDLRDQSSIEGAFDGLGRFDVGDIARSL